MRESDERRENDVKSENNEGYENDAGYGNDKVGTDKFVCKHFAMVLSMVIEFYIFTRLL